MYMQREHYVLDAKMSCKWDSKDIELQGATQDRMNWLQYSTNIQEKSEEQGGKSNISAEISY